MADAADVARVGITPADLGVTPEASLAAQARALLAQQKRTWDLLRDGYATLAGVRTRQFRFDGYQVRVQFNPGRLTSSSARVDDRSIRERRCFLCLPHLPEPQRGIPFGDRFMLLCNPFPIFPEHFTIPTLDHVPQRIAGEAGTMLGLARALAPLYTVFYNGPRCGASAPDHLHFQAGSRGFMPIEGQLARLRAEHGRAIDAGAGVTAHAVEGGARRFVVFTATDGAAAAVAVDRYMVRLGAITDEADEPMVNIIAWYDDERWTVLVFPRAKHRPSFFFAEGDERLLISPAAVDLGGVSITPVDADFHKVRHEHLATMYQEVLLSKSEFAESIT